MPTPFTRTWKALDSDASGWTAAGIASAAVLAAGCALWTALAPVTLYEVTNSARIEAKDAVYPVASPVAGRVIRSRLAVGREVKEGEVLVEVDSALEQLDIREQQVRQEALRHQVEALRGQIDAEQRARDQEMEAGRLGREENQAQARQAEIEAGHAEGEQRRFQQLYDSRLISQSAYQKGVADAQRLRAEAQAKTIAVDRAGQDQLTRDKDRAARIRGLESQIAVLESEIPTLEAAIARLRTEVEKRLVRAPISGKLGEAAVLRPGAVVREGDKLGAIVASGKLALVAQFVPSAALGRIRNGQPARIRLDGFPWIQYGVLTARVTEVAGEVRDGTVRVEMAMDNTTARSIPLQHGLPGSVEVEVERATPWSLLMRHAGRRWGQPTVAMAGSSD
jgi:membrane fusion protein (multidrug efflux system)